MPNSELQESNNPFDAKESSEAYKTVDPVYQKSAEAALSFVDPGQYRDQEHKVLDIGAGTGIASELILNKGVQNLTLLEPSAAMLDQAELRLGDKVKYLQGTIEESIGIFNASIDLAYALNCFHLFTDLSQALASIACSLKPQGVFVFNLSSPSYIFDNLTETELKIIKANLEFYKGLNQIAQNEILEQTTLLLEKVIQGDSTNLLNKDKVEQFFMSVMMQLIDQKEITIEVNSDYQRNIWRMMAASFTQEMEKVEDLIKSLELPENLVIRQALFKFENHSHELQS